MEFTDFQCTEGLKNKFLVYHMLDIYKKKYASIWTIP